MKKNFYFLLIITLFISGCLSLTEFERTVKIPKITRLENSKLAILNVRYAPQVGLEVIITNKTKENVEIVWSESILNDEDIVLAGSPRKDVDKKAKSEFLIRGEILKRVIFPRSTVLNFFPDPAPTKPIKYPVYLEVVFKQNDYKDVSKIKIEEDFNTKKVKINLFGEIIDDTN